MNLSEPNKKSSLVQSESGIFVEPSFLLGSKDNYGKAKSEMMKSYEEKRNHQLSSPVPNIRVPFSYILTRAVPPKMSNVLENVGLIQETIDADERLLEQLKYMSDNVSNEQVIVSTGRLVNEFGVGDKVKIDFKRYRSVRDGAGGSIDTYFDIPSYTIDGFKYLLLDERDVIWVINDYEEGEELNLNKEV